MPRHRRLVVPGLPLHVIQRGNNRMVCFTRDADHLVYLALLRQTLRKAGCALHAYCLMSNHVHLLLTPDRPAACASLMHEMAQRYAYYFNRAHGRTGTLWEGRFRSCLVESAEYILACYRYIELNPVRAGMVSHAETYPWSSFAGNSGSRTDPLLTPHEEFKATSRSDYLAMIGAGMASDTLERIRLATNGGYPLVTEALKVTLEATAARALTRGKPGRPPKDREDVGKSEPVPDLFSGGGAS